MLKYFAAARSISQAKSILDTQIHQLEYFCDCKGLEAANTKKRQLARRFHPDTNPGEGWRMTNVNSEYETFVELHNEFNVFKQMLKQNPHLFKEPTKPKNPFVETIQQRINSETVDNFKHELRKKENREALSNAAGTVANTLISSLVNSLLK